MSAKHILTLTKITIFLAFAAAIQCQEEDDESEQSNPLQAFRDQLKSNVSFCSPGLANAYGLNGLQNPYALNQTGFMCWPDIKYTCCSNSDAESAFATIGGGLKRLKQHYAVYSEIVKKFMEQLVIVSKIAGRVTDRLAEIKFSNCKVLASKIVLYDITKVSKQVIEALSSQYKFMLYSYKGFYCEICDGMKNKFVFDDDGFVIINKKHCRKNVENSIKSMYYLRVLFVNYVNLVVKFMNNCDAKGTYFDDVVMNQLVLNSTPEDKVIERCWNDRNSPKWLEECKDFCDKFNFVSLNDFWKPNAEKFALITAFLTKRALQMVTQETLDSSIDTPSVSATASLLEDLGVNQAPPLKFLNGFTDDDYRTADQQIQIQLQSMGSGAIITAIAGSGSPIDQNIYVYMDKGFDFFSTGTTTGIQTTDDPNVPPAEMCKKESFSVDRVDNKMGIPQSAGQGAGGRSLKDREMVNLEDGLDDDSALQYDSEVPVENSQTEGAVDSAKVTKKKSSRGRHSRHLATESLTKITGLMVGLIMFYLGF